MAIYDYDNPNSTGYEQPIREVITYVMVRIPQTIEIVKTIEPSYPQARKNKRDNFKSK